MPTTSLMPLPKQQYMTVLGTPLVGGKVYTYAAGGTVPKATYTDSAGSTPQANPIILNLRGEPASPIYWSGNYRVDVRDALNNLVYTVDNYNTDPAGLWALAGNFLTSAGAALIGFLQAGAGAILRTVQSELRDVVRVSQFGAVPGTATDQGPKILAAHVYAQSVNATLEFPGGEYSIAPGTSFTIDLSKTRWVGRGPTTLRWTAAPTSGVAVTVVNSELNPYETARRLVGRIIDNMSICGSTDAGSSFAAVGLRFGNGVNQTCGFTVSQMTLSGWTIAEDWTNNVWSVLHDKCRILWGAINTPTVAGNWGENNVFHDCFIADGVIMTLNYGEWRFFGGSLDNAQIIVKNNAFMSWFGPHIENPGSNTIARPFISRQNEATAHLVSPQLVVNNNGTTITQAPFESLPGTGMLVLDGLQYTQGGPYQWFSQVIGGGPVDIRNPQILAFNNFNFQVIAENTRGQLRNYGFEENAAGVSPSGWVVTGNTSFGTAFTVATSTARVRPGSTGTKSCLLTVTKTSSVYGDVTITQTTAVRAGELFMIGYGYNRQYSGMAGQFATLITWLDIAGATLYTSNSGFINSAAGTDDGAVFGSNRYNERVPAGAVQARIAITLQSLTGIGTVNLYLDDVFVNAG